MSKRPAATTIGRTSPRQTRREYRVSAPPGGLGGSGERGGGASRRATLNGVARDSPGLVRQGVGVLTSAIAARVESKQVNGGGSAKQRQPGHSAVTVGILLCPELN